MPSAVAVDFVGLFRKHGLDYLTREIMMLLVSPEEEECSLVKAKLVSGQWREAVDNLVLNIDVGKVAYLHKIKNIMKR